MWFSHLKMIVSYPFYNFLTCTIDTAQPGGLVDDYLTLVACPALSSGNTPIWSFARLLSLIFLPPSTALPFSDVHAIKNSGYL